MELRGADGVGKPSLPTLLDRGWSACAGNQTGVYTSGTRLGSGANMEGVQLEEAQFLLCICITKQEVVDQIPDDDRASPGEPAIQAAEGIFGPKCVEIRRHHLTNDHFAFNFYDTFDAWLKRVGQGAELKLFTDILFHLRRAESGPLRATMRTGRASRKHVLVSGSRMLDFANMLERMRTTVQPLQIEVRAARSFGWWTSSLDQKIAMEPHAIVSLRAPRLDDALLREIAFWHATYLCQESTYCRVARADGLWKGRIYSVPFPRQKPPVIRAVDARDDGIQMKEDDEVLVALHEHPRSTLERYTFVETFLAPPNAERADAVVSGLTIEVSDDERDVLLRSSLEFKDSVLDQVRRLLVLVEAENSQQYEAAVLAEDMENGYYLVPGALGCSEHLVRLLQSGSVVPNKWWSLESALIHGLRAEITWNECHCAAQIQIAVAKAHTLPDTEYAPARYVCSHAEPCVVHPSSESLHQPVCQRTKVTPDASWSERAWKASYFA